MFKYRLASVLRLKEHNEKICLKEVGKNVALLRYECKRKEQMENEIIELENDFVYFLKGSISSEEISLYRNYLCYKYELSKLQEQVVLEVKRDLENSKERLMNAIKERKMLTKLRDKQYNKYQSEQEKLEQVIQDELAVTTKRR
ncbi:MAG: flagellar export protein FliJ [Clostridia bacterium]|nr:flagellar export protein FliJ [Clostridia bacterium]MDD4048301.1 flagellar export protein FliJ [Clostridia bacterium]